MMRLIDPRWGFNWKNWSTPYIGVMKLGEWLVFWVVVGSFYAEVTLELGEHDALETPTD